MEPKSPKLLDQVRQFGLDLADVLVQVGKPADHNCHQTSQHEHQVYAMTSGRNTGLPQKWGRCCKDIQQAIATFPTLSS